MMDCGKAKEYIDLYVDGRLNLEETDQLLLHTQSCSACRTELESAVTLKSAFDALPDIEPPVGLAASAIKKAKKRKVPFYAYATAGVAVAAALIAVFASGILGDRSAADNSYKGTTESMVFDTSAADEPAGAQNALTSETAEEETTEDSVAMDVMSADDSTESEDCTDEADMEAAISESTIYVSQQARGTLRPELEEYFETNGIMPEYTLSDDIEEISFFIEEYYFEDLELLLQSYDIEYEGEFLPGAYLTIVFESE